MSTEELIEEVKPYPILYDMTHIDYKNVYKKELLWDRIARRLGANSGDMKKKWKNLRDTYAKYLKSARGQMYVSGEGNVKAWVWAERMAPFYPYMSQTSSKAMLEYSLVKQPTLTEESTPIQEPSDPLNNGYDLKNIKTEPEIEITPSEESEYDHEPPIKKRYKRSQKSSPQNDLTNTRLGVVDAIDSIFLAHAMTVKKFSAVRQAETKLKMAQLIAEQEFLHLEEQRENGVVGSKPCVPDLVPIDNGPSIVNVECDVTWSDAST